MKSTNELEQKCMTTVFQSPKQGDQVVIVCFCDDHLKHALIEFITGHTVASILNCVHGQSSEIQISRCECKTCGYDGLTFNPDGVCLDDGFECLLLAPNTKKDRQRLYAIVARKIREFHKKGKSA